jgi:hypothetical protein
MFDALIRRDSSRWKQLLAFRDEIDAMTVDDVRRILMSVELAEEMSD